MPLKPLAQTSPRDRARAERRLRQRKKKVAATLPQRHGDRSSGDGDAAVHRYLTGPQVCARYAITDMSLWRWLQDPDLDFPRPAMRVRDRRYWLETDLAHWEVEKQVARA